jgi:hypothetical protein
MKINTLLIVVFFWFVSTAQAQWFDDYNSNKGQGLYFREKKPKRSDLKFVAKAVVAEKLQYANFYEDKVTGKIYLQSSFDVELVDNILKPKPAKGKKSGQSVSAIMDDESICEIGVAEEGVFSQNTYADFISINHDLLFPTLNLPQHHLFSPRPFAIHPNRKDLNINAILLKLNKIGLRKSEEVKTKHGGFNIFYDRLFINDDDPDKFLIIWLNNDRVYANYLSNSGEWLFSAPKIIHQEITCFDKNYSALNRKLDEATDKSTLVTELNSIKSGKNYYVGYSITSWEGSPCFMSNIPTCHILKLNDSLQVEKSVQIPDKVFVEGNKLFASDFQLQLFMNQDTLCTFIQSPNVGEDKLFAQCFTKELTPIGKLMYLSCSSKTYADLVPVVATKNGFWVTYKEARKSSDDIYSQFVNCNGSANQPVSVFAMPTAAREYMLRYYARKNADGSLDYYFTIRDPKSETTELRHYRTDLTSLDKDLAYNITLENWKQDKTVMDINNLVGQTDNRIKQKQYIEFQREVSKSCKRFAYSNNAMDILKFTETQERQNSKFILTAYFDLSQTLRFAHIYTESKRNNNLVEKKDITVYFNSDGESYWEMMLDQDGKLTTDPHDIKAGRYLRDFKSKSVYSTFHSKN